VEVGPSGTYKTIGAALAFAKENYNTSIRSVMLIKVAPGNYPERIVMDKSFHPGIQIESASPDQPIVLNPPGNEPIVDLREECKRFVLKNVRLEARDRAKAIRFEGDIEGVTLEQITIDGFTGVGVSFEGAYPFVTPNTLKDVTFKPANPAAVGVKFGKSGDFESVRMNVFGCKFLGPMTTGIEFDTAIDVEIANSIFSDCTTGIRFLGTDKTWKTVTFSHNTFFRNTNGILWEDIPASSSDELGFYNNLFVETKGTPVAMVKNYVEIKFSPMFAKRLGSGVENNWTDSTIAVPPAPDAVRLFESLGQSAIAKPLFVSTDPNSPDFLVPVAGSPLLNQTSRDAHGNFVGARGAK